MSQRPDFHHPDPAQLLFQVREIVDQQIYLRHGITIRPGDLVLDIGANVGVASVFFAQHGATVHSFEPVPQTFEILTRNIAGLDCQPHNYGLSNQARTAQICYYPRGDAMSTLHEDRASDEHTVRTAMHDLGLDDTEISRRLDGCFDPTLLDVQLRTLTDVFADLDLDEVDLLKIDVERSELEVLEGMAETDWPKVRQVVVEVDDRHLVGVVHLLERFGFTVECERQTLWMVYAWR